MLTRQLLSAYDSQLSRLEGAAYEYAARRISSFVDRFPNATAAQVREFAIEVVDQAVASYGDAASTLAADLYDGMAEAAGAKVGSAMLDASDVFGYIDRDVRYQMRKYLAGDSAGFAEACGKSAEDQVSRRANQTMRTNASRDGLRYARVPMGGETCTFCAMLASRGFVYTSAKAAGEGNHYHKHCRCKVVPGFDGMEVEGYDPDEWHERWKKFEEIDADDSMTTAQKLAVKRVLTGGGDEATSVSASLQSKGLSEGHAKEIEKIVSSCTDESAKELFEKSLQGLSFDTVTAKSGKAWYNPSSHGLTLNLEDSAAGFSYRGDKAPYQTFFHEVGHYIDHAATGYDFEIIGRYKVGKTASSVNKLGETAEKEVKQLLNSIKKQNECSMYDAKVILEDEVRSIPKKQLGGFADIVHGATSGTCCWGHKKSYWKRKDGGLNNLSTETFAHFFETTMVNPDALETLTKYLPETYNVFKKIIGGGT